MATPIKVGDEFLVNTTVTGSQIDPRITHLSNGKFVVVWTDESRTGSDTSYYAVRAQIFNINGTRSGSEFLVNTATYNLQFEPTITTLADGRFVLAWEDRSETAGDSSGSGIHGQIFNADGTRSGAEFLVNRTTVNNEMNPEITALANGGFVAVWQVYGLPGGIAVRSQVFNADGSRVGAELLVSQTNSWREIEPKVTALSNGGYVVLWDNLVESGGAIMSITSRARVFNADGTRSSKEFSVHDSADGYGEESSITALANGRFVVAWKDYSENLTVDTDFGDIHARVFNADGTRAGREFVINQNSESYQFHPEITALADGRFVAAWVDWSHSFEDFTAIYVRVFNNDGTPAGDQIQVNTTTFDGEWKPTISAFGDSTFTVVWQGYSQTSGDWDLRAQTFEIPNPASTIKAAEIFAAEGKLAFLSQLALAAYHHADWEQNITLVNERNPYAEFAFAGGSKVDGNEFTPVADNLQLLTPTELQGLQPDMNWSVDPDDPDAIDNSFPKNGLKDGIFTNENAAALVGRSADAIFLSFRGTNDNATGGGLRGISTPDKEHWTAMGQHYALFQDLIAALQAYVVRVNTDVDRTNDVTTLYVTGHSLGAAMVQAFMEDWTKTEMTRDWAGITAEAVTFASPGYGFDDVFADDRIANFWNVRDPILLATWFGSNEGYRTFIEHNLEKGVNLNDGPSVHSMALYNGFVQFFWANGIDLDELNASDNPGQHFASIYADVHVLNEDKQLFQIGINADVLDGSRFDNLMLGGANDDLLSGSGGADRLLGGADWDKLYGGPGEDTLEGGYGYDELTGGAGRDRFIFNSVKETNSQGTGSRADLIKDFDSRFLLKDFIDLREIDANWGLSGNQAFDFIEGTGFGRVAGQLRYEQRGGETIIMGDTDGDGVQNFFIRLTGLHTLSDAYFVL